MLVLHAHGGVGLAAHGVHYAIVAAGVLGLVALLTPRFMAAPRARHDEHEARERVLLPLAVVSSAAAAAVHAAVAPEHLRESALIGVFFIGSALLQLAWAGAALRHGSRWLLAAGAAGNLAVIGLWAVTRTVGLPFGLLTAREPVGPWDLACCAWELVVAGCCLAALHSDRPLVPRRTGWRHWHAALPSYAAGSALLLLALSTGGAGS